jgi:transcriptional regulator with XRE-family HTH domain
MPAVNTKHVRSLARQKGLSLSHLARTAGISRQMLHNLLRPGFNPLVGSLQQLGVALGVDPLELLETSPMAPAGRPSLESTLKATLGGDARAFEMLPALLVNSKAQVKLPDELDVPTAWQLLGAAAQMAYDLTDEVSLKRLAAFCASNAGVHNGFFFGLPLVSLQRLMEQTPEPMKKHRIFGAFSMEDFRRHL